MPNENGLPESVVKQGQDADDRLNKIVAAKSGEVPGAPPAEPEPNPTPVEPQPVGNEDWKHKFEVSQGMLQKQGAEVSELRQTNQYLISELTAIRAELAGIKAGDVNKPSEPQKPKASLLDIDGIKGLLSEEEQETLDRDGIEDSSLPILAKLIYNIAGSQVGNLSDQVNDIKATQSKTMAQVFDEGLIKLVPDWRVINSDANFVNWLHANMAPGTNETYHALLNYHNQQHDYVKCAEIFNLFKEVSGLSGKDTSGANLGNQLEPGQRSAPTATPTSADNERIWKSAEISKAYNDIARGKIKGDEAKALQAEMDRAYLDGRVTA